MGAVTIRSELDNLFTTSMKPQIHHVIQSKFDTKKDKIPMIFNVEGSSRDFENVTSVTGFGAVPAKSEGVKIASDKMLKGFSQSFTHTTYALSFTTSQEMIEDEKHGVIRKGATSLAKSMFQTRQVTAADIFNNAFDSSVTYGDGKELCATDHPLKGGGTEQNELTTGAALSKTSLREAINTLEDTVDHRGIKVNIKAKTLLVPNELKWTAKELLGSQGDSETANNALNAFADEDLMWLDWHYLTSSTRWFLLAEHDDHELIFFERVGVQVGSFFDDYVQAGVTTIRNRFSVGPADWPGVFGSDV